MKPSSIAAGYSVNAVLELRLDGTYSNVVTIEAFSPNPAAAADAANAYAAAFIAWGRDSTRTQVSEAIAVVQSEDGFLHHHASRDTSEYAALKTSLEQLQLLRQARAGASR